MSTNAAKRYFRTENVTITKTKEPNGKMRKQHLQTTQTIIGNEEQQTTVHFNTERFNGKKSGGIIDWRITKARCYMQAVNRNKIEFMVSHAFIVPNNNYQTKYIFWII